MRTLAALLFVGAQALSTVQAPVDVAKIGPKVGAAVPSFSGIDQDGQTQSLKSVAGPKGTMLVFFRSADW